MNSSGYYHNNRNLVAKLSPPNEMVKVNRQQEKILEHNFQQYKNIDEVTMELLAAETGLSLRDCEKWFQHRKALWRKKEGLSPNSRAITD
ncbi:homeodomain-only protein-like [Saccoglossus kowalevskii]|uniref:Homeodomain-only protein n=1 Tax=Saccoglossus kowalevskii TaxID=10224 RepID=A0ABM0GTS9_SACKO|nr:PREDICTED: homeodomain-only protein-like [Saccoglossus kowalevskii]